MAKGVAWIEFGMAGRAETGYTASNWLLCRYGVWRRRREHRFHAANGQSLGSRWWWSSNGTTIAVRLVVWRRRRIRGPFICQWIEFRACCLRSSARPLHLCLRLAGLKLLQFSLYLLHLLLKIS